MNRTSMTFALSRRGTLALALAGALVVGLVASFAGVHPALAAARMAERPESGGWPNAFTVTATSSNTSGYILFINNSTYTNNQPTINVQATQVWPDNYDAHPYGVWYDPLVKEWTVFNEDEAAIPLGTSFTISTWANGNSVFFSFTATASNSSGDSAYINNSSLNSQPNAQFQATQNYTGTYDPHTTGVWYNASKQEWAIFNEDDTAIPAGSSFFIQIELTSNENYYTYTQVATTSNTSSYITFINDPAINNQPNLYPLVTQVWDAQDKCGCVYNSHPVAAWYDSAVGEWAIYNVDMAAMPTGAEFFFEDVETP